MRRLSILTITIVLCLSGFAVAQTTLDSAWDGTTGNWVNSNGWDVLGGGDSYPDNNASYVYNVTLPGGSYVLSTVAAADLELLSLGVGPGARLALDDDSLAPGALSNDGIIELNHGVLTLSAATTNGGVIRFDLDSSDSEDLVIATTLTLAGDGKIVFRDNDPSVDDPDTAEIVIGSNGLTLTQESGHSIEGGPGQLRGAGTGLVTFVNEGAVRANVPLRTILLNAGTNGLTVTNTGQMIAEDLGTLQVVGASLANSGGSLTSDSAILDFDGVTITGNGALALSNWGEADFDSATSATFGTITNINGIIPSTGTSLTTDNYSGAGALTVDSVLTINSVMTVEADTRLTIENGARINVGDQLVNEMTAEADFDFGSNGELRFTSATGALPYEYGLFGTLEVAGEDLGVDSNGFIQNFALPNLIIAAEAKVNLVDLRDNANRGGVGGNAEALYVDTLTFADSNGILNLNGLHLYYNTLDGNPIQIKDSQSATLSTWICGEGNWNQTACWDQLGGTDTYPDNNGYQYEVFLPSGAPYTVTANISGIELNALDVDADAMLNLVSTFNPGALSNDGTIEHQGSTLTLEENVVNNGTLRYDTDSTSEYISITSDVTLGGSGTLQSQCPSSGTSYRDRLRVYDTKTLTNGPDHTIEGGYTLIYLNSGSASFVNDGAVRSNNNRYIEFETGGEPSSFTVTNNNLMKAENAGDLNFDGVAVSNTGTITADGTDSIVYFASNTTLDSESGTLGATTNGVLEIRSELAEVADFGTVDAADGTVRFYGTVIDSNGTWVIGDNHGDFTIGGGAVLEGFTFQSPDAHLIKLTGATLTNVNIDSPAVVEINSGTQYLYGTFDNDGTLRFGTASSQERLSIMADVELNSPSETGVLQSQSTSSSDNYIDLIRVYDGTTLTHGTGYTFEGGYAKVLRYSGDAAFVNDGEVRSNNDRFIEFETGGDPSTFTITNNNLMTAENASDLYFDGVAVTNTGTIAADGANSRAYFYSDTTLDNESGTLQATTNGVLEIRSLIAETADLGTFDAAGGTVNFYGTLIDSNGAWVIDGTYGDFTIGGGAAVLQGVTLQSPEAHLINLSGAYLTDISIDSPAELEFTNGATQYLYGTIANDGTLRYSTGSSQETLRMAVDVELSSPGGTGVLQSVSTSSSDSYLDRILVYDGTTLTHGAGHTFEGGYAKVLRYSGNAAFVNNGEVRSNNDRFIEFETTGEPDTFTVTNNNLMISENTSDLYFDGVAVTNAGTISADGTNSKVNFYSDTTLDNSAGVLQALNNGEMTVSSTLASVADFGTIDAAGGSFSFAGTLNDPGATWTTGNNYGNFTIGSADITGVTFASADGNLIQLTGSSNFTDVTIDPTATLENQSSVQYLFGTFTNNGMFRYDTDTGVEYIYINNGDILLDGDGTILFQNSYSSTSSGRDRINIYDGFTLTNGPDHKLVGGYASILRSTGMVAFVNQGEVRCNLDRTILFDSQSTPSTFVVTNNGDVIAENDGEIQFEDVELINENLMHADGTGSKVRFLGVTTVDNTTGTLQATDGGTIEFSSAAVVDEIADLGTFAATNGIVLMSPKFNQPGETWVIDAGYGDLSFQSSTALTGITIQSPDNHVAKLTTSTANFTDITIDGAVIEMTTNLNVYGTLTNNGTIRTDADSYTESLIITTDLDLAGNGTLLFQNPGSAYRDRIQLNGTVTVTNTANHTIESAYGYIERVSGDAVFVNDGVILANVSGTALSTYNPSGNYTDFSFVNNNQMTAENGGNIYIDDVTFTNNGTLTADGTGSNLYFYSSTVLDNSAGLLSAINSGKVIFNSAFTTTDGGNLSATAGGEIELNSTTLATDGTITIDGGILDLNGTTLTGGSALLLSSNGQATFDSTTTATFGSIENDGVMTLSGATVTTGTYTGAGELSVSSELAVSDLMTIETGSDLFVDDGDRITVGGNYDLQMVFDINYSYDSTGELRLTGGTGAGPEEFDQFATHEVAGQDLDENDDPTQGSAAGFVDNFSLRDLLIGPGAKIRLVDNRDNGHRGGTDGMGNEPEALYVNDLTFEDGNGLLALNGFRIYYNNLNGSPDQIITGADCNTNGVADNRDIAGATSEDCNDTGIPDECEIAAGTSLDCNVNAVPDACDLTGTTSEDCNSNSIPDECDIAAVTSFDINDNGIPDECEDDCNTNAIPDECDIDCGEPEGPCDVPGCGLSADCNNNGIPDECEPGGATSTWIGPDNEYFDNPVNWDPFGVPDGAVVLSNTTAVDNRCLLDVPGTTTVCGLLIEATGAGRQALRIDDGATLSPTGGSVVSTGGDLELRGGILTGGALTNTSDSINGYGTITVDLDNQGIVEGSSVATLVLSGSVFANQSAGTVTAPTASTVYVSSTNVIQAGRIEVQSNASVVFDEPLVNTSGAEIELSGGTVDAAGITNDVLGDMHGFGTINTNLTNNGAVTVIADTEIVGDLINDGIVTIQSGLLTVTGSVSGSGQIIGDFGGRADGDGMTVIGDYGIGAAGELLMPSGTLKIGGHFDNAIDDYNKFDLTTATLQMVGLPEDAPQLLEAAAPDNGRHVALPVTLLFSMGTLRIGPTATTVQIVDLYDNSTGADPEAIYVDELLLEPGVTFDLNGHAVYFNSVTPAKPLNPASGVTVIDSAGGGKLRFIGLQEKGDYDDDGDMDLPDYAEFPACLSGPAGGLGTGCAIFDFEPDGNVDLFDFAEFQSTFTGDLYE